MNMIKAGRIVESVFKLNKEWELINESQSIKKLGEHDVAISGLIDTLISANLDFGYSDDHELDYIIKLKDGIHLRLKSGYLKWLPKYRIGKRREVINIINDDNTLEKCLSLVKDVFYVPETSIISCDRCKFVFIRGRYKGEEIRDVVMSDDNYIEWILNERTMIESIKNVVRYIKAHSPVSFM